MKREYPICPLIGVGALIMDGERVLIVRRESEPGKGLWSIPGGLLEVGETVRDGARREVKEETGLDVEVDELLDVVDNITRDEEGRIRYHYVLIDFLCHPVGGELNPDTDVKEARWVGIEELDSFPTTRTLKHLLTKAKLKKREGEKDSTSS